MGILSFEHPKFYFVDHPHDRRAERAGLKWNEIALRWETRNICKAVKLRRFADKSAELKFKKYFITDYEPPEQIIYPDHQAPKSFQMVSAWHCLTRSPAYCADEAGLGKTITSILCMNTVPGKTLIVCPPFLKWNWETELTRWIADELNHYTMSVIETGNAPVTQFDSDIIILPDSLITNPRIKMNLSLHEFKWLFVDEAHRYKEATTQRTQSLLGKEKEDTHGWYHVTQSADRVVFLSGTPIPNGRPIELFPLLSHAAPGSIGHRSKMEYGKTFCDAKELTRFEGRRVVRNWDYSGSSNLKQLRAELREKFMIRHLKKDVLTELGPKSRKIIFLDEPKRLKPFEKRAMKDRSLDELMGDDHELGDIAVYRREVGEAKIPLALEYIQELLENSPDKIVVFAHHIEVVESLHQMLAPFHALMIRGGLSSKQKNEQVKLFQTKAKHRVIVGNIDAMGVGLTLTKAPGVVVVEPSWVPGINEQAEDRVHRLTQNENVYIRYLVLRNSLDERMLLKVLDKQNAINQVMD